MDSGTKFRFTPTNSVLDDMSAVDLDDSDMDWSMYDHVATVLRHGADSHLECHEQVEDDQQHAMMALEQGGEQWTCYKCCMENTADVCIECARKRSLRFNRQHTFHCAACTSVTQRLLPLLALLVTSVRSISNYPALIHSCNT
jgi:hypothetical protein